MIDREALLVTDLLKKHKIQSQKAANEDPLSDRVKLDEQEHGTPGPRDEQETIFVCSMKTSMNKRRC